MGIRLFLVLLVGLALGVSFTLTTYLSHVIAQFSMLFPEAYAPIAASLIVGLPIAVGSLVALSYFVVRPLRQVCAAMGKFVAEGTRQELPPFKGSPKELQELGKVFVTFTERIEETHAKDVEMGRVKSDFISTAAHQLRTPLTGIRWAMEALQKEPLTETQQLLVKSAVDKSHDLVDVVGTLLDISSIESGKHKYEFANEDIQGLVAETAQDFAHAAEEAKVSFLYEPGPVPLMVRMDRERVKWILNNLIENAIRYTPVGGSVIIKSEGVPGRVMVTVRDTGIGIPQEDRNNIFERFYRAGNAITKQNQGNGLGLYIARTIAQDHRGDLSFEQNTNGPGTTFTLALPSA